MCGVFAAGGGRQARFDVTALASSIKKFNDLLSPADAPYDPAPSGNCRIAEGRLG